jgi:mRNA interferase HigB
MFPTMRIIAIKTLRDFWEKPGYHDAEPSLRAWYAEARKAGWKGPDDIKEDYRSASIVGNNRVVFNIKGNKYRLVVAVRYEFGLVFVRFIGMHDQYDKIDARRI